MHHYDNVMANEVAALVAQALKDSLTYDVTIVGNQITISIAKGVLIDNTVNES